MGALESGEKQFFAILEYGKTDERALDLIIRWPQIAYNDRYTNNDVVIISSGEINFSKLCRDEPESFGLIQTYIRIIANFEISMAIIIQIYNLVLSTLGIDNPYLYEEQQGGYYVNEVHDDLGNSYHSVTQYDGRGNTITRRYNDTKPPVKKQIGFRR